MTTSAAQVMDRFTDADPAIRFDPDQIWTINPGVLVSTGANDAIFSESLNSSLFNNGSVLSAFEFEGSVTFDGENGFISNAAGARIIGANDGVLLDGHVESVDNHGSINGLADDGVTFADYNSTEKVADLPRKLSTRSAPAGFDPDVGDIAYYAPWGNVAIFYRDFGYSSGLVKLGRLDGGVESLRGGGPLRVTIERADRTSPP